MVQVRPSLDPCSSKERGWLPPPPGARRGRVGLERGLDGRGGSSGGLAGRREVLRRTVVVAVGEVCRHQLDGQEVDQEPRAGRTTRPHGRVGAWMPIGADDARRLRRVALLVATVRRVVVGSVGGPVEAHLARVGGVGVAGAAEVGAECVKDAAGVEGGVVARAEGEGAQQLAGHRRGGRDDWRDLHDGRAIGRTGRGACHDRGHRRHRPRHHRALDDWD